MTEIENSRACFVRLWRKLERTRRLFRTRCRYYCVRRVLQSWFGAEATDDFINEVCWRCELAGFDGLPPPSVSPRPHRELLRAVVAVRLGISMLKVDLRALDAAYGEVFPHGTPLNVSKKKRSSQ